MTNSADPDQLASSDLDQHCLLRQGMSRSAREGLSLLEIKTTPPFRQDFGSPKCFLSSYSKCLKIVFKVSDKWHMQTV